MGTVFASGDEKAHPEVLLVPSWNNMASMNEELYEYLLSEPDYKGVVFNPSMVERINEMGI